MCGRSCSHKSDCQSEYEGTRNECMECDSDIGICVPLSTSSEDDVASTTDTGDSLTDFIEESSGFCGEYCDHNNDCPQGGFDPCNQCKDNHCVKESWEKENRGGGRGLEMCGQSCVNRLDCRSEYSGTENQCMECNNGRCTNQEGKEESATEELFPDFIEESSGVCGQYCSDSNDCQTKCNQCVSNKCVEESATKKEDNESTSSAVSFLKENEEVGNTCGYRCENNNDCFHGGYIECGRCRLLDGRDHKTCVPKNIAPESDRGYEMCGLPCEHNNDCKAEYEGTENRCMLCGQREGIFGVKRCISWDDKDEESDVVTTSKYLRAARK